MPLRFIDRFDVILLDMAGTFMFDVDRFAPTEDFAAAYRQIGGTALSDQSVCDTITVLFSAILSDYEHPRAVESFSTVRAYLEQLSVSKNLPGNEVALLERVFALHEVGKIPEAYAEALQQLRKTHRLRVVSDIWSKSDLFLQEFDRAGVRDVFDVIVFSSDHGCVKPSPSLFMKAIEAFVVDRNKIVFVGDSLQRDIAGAKAAGVATVWINATGAARTEENPEPDFVIQDLRELLEQPTNASCA